MVAVTPGRSGRWRRAQRGRGRVPGKDAVSFQAPCCPPTSAPSLPHPHNGAQDPASASPCPCRPSGLPCPCLAKVSVPRLGCGSLAESCMRSVPVAVSAGPTDLPYGTTQRSGCYHAPPCRVTEPPAPTASWRGSACPPHFLGSPYPQLFSLQTPSPSTAAAADPGASSSRLLARTLCCLTTAILLRGGHQARIRLFFPAVLGGDQ